MCRTDLVAGNDARKFTVSGPFFFDLLPETTNLFERGAIVDRVDQEERVSRRDGQAPHRRELEVATKNGRASVIILLQVKIPVGTA